MASSKTKAGREKFKIIYYVGEVEVHPARVGRSMFWIDDANTIRAKTWTRKKVVKIGGKE